MGLDGEINMIANIIEVVVVYTLGFVVGSVAAIKHPEYMPNFIKRMAGEKIRR